MLAWYDDINSLINKTGDERNAFVTRHKRSLSTGSNRSFSSDGGLEEDEADRVPFSSADSVTNQPAMQETERPSRPSPGGRFPSDLQVNRSLQARGPSSGSSSEVGLDLATAAGGPQMAHASYPNAYDDRTPYDAAYGPGNPYEYHPDNQPQQLQQQTSYFANNPPATPGQNAANSAPAVQPVPYQPYQPSAPAQAFPPQQQPQHQYPSFTQGQRHASNYGDWMTPAAAGAGGLAAGAVGAEALHRHNQDKEQVDEANAASQHENPALVAGAVPVSRSGDGLQDESHEAFSGVAAPVIVSTEGQAAPAETRELPQATPALAAAEEGKQIGAANGEVSVGQAQAQAQVAPGVKRQGTDFSVSDLHVPGEYPKQRAV